METKIQKKRPNWILESSLGIYAIYYMSQKILKNQVINKIRKHFQEKQMSVNKTKIENKELFFNYLHVGFK